MYRVKTRKNPSQMTTLAALPYRSDRLLLEYMRQSPSNETLEEASSRIAQQLRSEGIDAKEKNIRLRALQILSDYILREMRGDPSYAANWIIRRDHRLGVWCVLNVARFVSNFTVKGSRAALKATEAWVRGEGIDQNKAEEMVERLSRDAEPARHAIAFALASTFDQEYASAAVEAAINAIIEDSSMGYTDARYYARTRLTDVIVAAIMTLPEN